MLLLTLRCVLSFLYDYGGFSLYAIVCTCKKKKKNEYLHFNHTVTSVTGTLTLCCQCIEYTHKHTNVCSGDLPICFEFSIIFFLLCDTLYYFFFLRASHFSSLVLYIYVIYYVLLIKIWLIRFVFLYSIGNTKHVKLFKGSLKNVDNEPQNIQKTTHFISTLWNNC